MRRVEDATVRFKLVGRKTAVDKSIEILKKFFPLLVVGPIRPNDRDSGVHVFLNVDVAVMEATKITDNRERVH